MKDFPEQRGLIASGQDLVINLPPASPRWLVVTRDAVIVVVGLIVIAATILLAAAVHDAGRAVDQLTTPSSTSSPADTGIPTCAPGQTIGCVDSGG